MGAPLPGKQVKNRCINADGVQQVQRGDPLTIISYLLAFVNNHDIRRVVN